jgi:DNA-binding response OmpR family regulator
MAVGEPNVRQICLIEDDADTEALVLRALRRLGSPSIEVVRDGADAVRYFDSNPMSPDLVLLDLKLPGIDGFEVLRHIRGSESMRSTPVVIFSSEDAPLVREKARKLGANDYAVKPTNYNELVSVLRSLVSRYVTAVA